MLLQAEYLFLIFTIAILNKTGNARTAERLVAYHRGARFVYFIGNQGIY